MGVHPTDAPDEVEHFTVTFDRGIPLEVNGSPVIPFQALTEANRIGRKKRRWHRDSHRRKSVRRD